MNLAQSIRVFFTIKILLMSKEADGRFFIRSEELTAHIIVNAASIAFSARLSTKVIY